ncbi:MAG: C_GCAxxG_C_C family protein [Oscillospiraceae bacterium]|nr:C_GCAxxG_C_C family protein [Oscillospiraceae bacterium]
MVTDKLDREGCLKRAQLAFSSGYHCAQSALIAFAPACGLEQEQAAKLAASFGGGVGGMGELCGALSGVCIALGLLKGDFAPGDLESKEAHYARVQRLAERFKEANGSIYCRDIKREDPVEKKKYCTRCVTSAVEALLEELEEK